MKIHYQKVNEWNEKKKKVKHNFWFVILTNVIVEDDTDENESNNDEEEEEEDEPTPEKKPIVIKETSYKNFLFLPKKYQQFHQLLSIHLDQQHVINKNHQVNLFIPIYHSFTFSHHYSFNIWSFKGKIQYTTRFSNK